ncbi:MAG: tetratricopeptide repeat protein [Candidatus Omnitrophica bacterium]|nr:tetratricopeptide repeat protein [Candidatus Omnitrophota bacterium]
MSIILVRFFLSISIISFFSLVLAREVQNSSLQNRGYLIYKDISENKKQKEPFSLPEKRSLEEKKLTTLQKEARIYREEGLKLQRIGKLEEAVNFYEKAIALDPSYAQAYCDLGVIYEMKGLEQIAENYYLKSLQIDPNCLSAYFNLASLYEAKGDLKKAVEFWKKRVALGFPDDPWTKKALEHLENIALIDKELAKELQEKEVMELISAVRSAPKKPSLEKEPTKKLVVDEYLSRAEAKFKQGDYISALDEVAVAKHLDPSDTRIDKFIEKVHNKLKEETLRH